MRKLFVIIADLRTPFTLSPPKAPKLSSNFILLV